MKFEYEQYVRDVLSGKKIACEYIKLACQRFLDFKARNDIVFRPERAERAMKFIGMMKHFTGESAGKHFILEPWQQFIIASIFGFYWADDTTKRVTRNAYIECARKQGKTALAAAISLYCLVADGESAAECEMIANSSKQAGICFALAKGFSESIDKGKKKHFKKYRDSLRFEETHSILQVLSSDAGVADGYNSYVFVLDEFHAAPSTELYDVMKSSQGMRKNPLSIVITTAGFNLAGPCYRMRETNIQILQGIKKDDTQFTVIYTLDEGDDWRDEKNWLKCSPNLGVTVKKAYLRDQVHQADNNPSLQVGILTKNFNLWLQTSHIWIPNDFITKRMARLSLRNFKRFDYCYMGVDLSSVSDLTAVSIMAYDEDKSTYYFKSWAFLPETAVKESPNGYVYKQWADEGCLTLTKSNVVDYDEILKVILEINETVPIYKLMYDSWNSSQWALQATQAGLPLYPYSQSLGSFNRPTKEFERAVRNGKVVIDKNPVTLWCFNNVALKSDYNENCKPIKGSGKDNKIDIVISMLEALGGLLNGQFYDSNIEYQPEEKK